MHRARPAGRSKRRCRSALGSPSRLAISITSVLLWVSGAVHSARGKNGEGTSGDEEGWQEGAGGLLLLAAAAETDLLPALEGAFSPAHPGADARLPHRTPTSARRLLMTLLFMAVVGLRRT